MSNLKLPSPSPEGSLSRYLQEIRKFPMLTADEEFMLAKNWRDSGDIEAAHRLVTSHLRLVAKIAMGYRGYGLPVGELIAEGNVGMMQAVKRFEPDKGFRLATYAMWWIRAAIQEYILRSWSLVKLGTTAAQKKLFFNLRKVKGQIKAIEEGDLTPEHVSQIAEKLNVSEDEVISMNRRMAAPDNSLNAPLRADSDGEWQDWLVDEDAVDQETHLVEKDEFEIRQELLEQAIETLNERERHILQERRLTDNPATLEDLSKEYGISRERVRQIEVRAFEKVQKAVKNAFIQRQLGRTGRKRPRGTGRIASIESIETRSSPPPDWQQGRRISFVAGSSSPGTDRAPAPCPRGPGSWRACAMGASINSSIRRIYLIAVAGRSAQLRAPFVLSLQPSMSS